MTKLELITAAATRLGNTTSAFLTLLRPIFDAVLEEMASQEALRSLWQSDTFNFTDNVRDYDTRAITALSNTGPDYPMAIKSLLVPAWGPVRGLLLRKSREEFDRLMLLRYNADGTPQQAQPRYWRLYPNETTLQVDPVPRAEDVDADVTILWLKPPASLGDNDPIVEVRNEHLPAIIAGLIKHGLVFDSETITDRPTAIAEFERYILRMKRMGRWDAGRGVRTRFRDF